MSRSRAIIGAVLLVAFALRLWRLGEQNVWWDEALAVWAVHKSFWGATLWTAGDVHPPLFFWALWPWMRLAGESTLAIRFLSVACGMLSAALAYALGRFVAGPRGGLVALILVSIARFEVWWSMELRMYMLAGMCVLGASYAMLRWLRRPASTRGLAAYGVFAVAALYTLYMSAAALALVNLAAILAILVLARAKPARGRMLRRWLTAQALVALAYLPWLAIALPRLSSWRVPGEPASPAFVLQLWATLLSTGVSADLGAVREWVAAWWGVVVILLLLLAAAGLRGRLETSADRRRLAEAQLLGPLTLALFVVAAPLIVWAATQPRSIFYSPNVEARYFVPFAGPVYVLAAWALAKAWAARPRLAGALAAALIGVQVLSLPGYYAERHRRDVTESLSMAIWSQAEEGDVVVLVSGNRYPMFHFDYDKDAAAPPVVAFPSQGSETVADHASWEGELNAIAERSRRVWLVELDHELQDPDRLAFGWLSDHRRLVLSEGYGPNALHLFNRDGVAPEAGRTDASWPGFAEELAGGVGAWLPARRLFPGDQLNLMLAGEPLRRADKVVINLIDDSGVAVWAAQSEGGRGSNRRRLTATVNERWPMAFWGGSYEVLARPTYMNAGFSSAGQAQWSQLDWLEVSGTPRRLGEDASCDVTSTAGPLRLCHFAVPDRAAAGEQVVLDLLWNAPPAALAALPLTTTVFAHLVGPPRPAGGDRVWAAGDGLPSSGAWNIARYELRPSRGGFQGGPIFDRHILALDAAAPPGRYEIELGLYDPATGTRYPVGGDMADAPNRRLVLGTVEVTAPTAFDVLGRNLSALWR